MKRITLGFITCCFLLASTSIYAKSEFALNIAHSFKGKFAFITDQSSEEVQQGISLLEEAVATQQEESMKKAEQSLENFGQVTTKDKFNEMSKYKSEYLQQVSETQENLMDSEWVMDDEDLQVMINAIDDDLLDVLEDILSE